jgi:thioredoxin-like negative regulator of GroEL
MLERLLFTLILIVVGVTIWLLYNRVSIAWLTNKALNDPILAKLDRGVPIILYFTMPFCEPCRTLQQPALEQLKADLGKSIQVVTIDSMLQPEIADRWGVMSVPTTFVLDSNHKPHTVNRGVASFDTLKRQLSKIVSVSTS